MRINEVEATVYTIPTDQPEADGTLAWDATTLVLVVVKSEAGEHGLGYTYAHAVAADLIRHKLAPLVRGLPLFAVGQAWEKMVHAVRNLGRPGVAAHAISAVDVALWDLKARSLGLPLFQLLGARRTAVPVYGSGGFTTYDDGRLQSQLAGWVADGIANVKIKIGEEWGSNEEEDTRRVALSREMIGAEAGLFVDANGGYTAKQAIRLGQFWAQTYDVTYFEEPVSSDQLPQLALVRQQVPTAVAAGEYGYDPWYFRAMLQAGAVDILQADVTRCLGITGWLMAADLAYGFDIPLSSHTAPALHVHLGCAAPQFSHLEYFYDHVRIERMLFDGFPRLEEGRLHPHPGRPGLGLAFKHQDAALYRRG